MRSHHWQCAESRGTMVTGVILAAGQARRMGQAKQLLPLDGKPIVWHVAMTACQILDEVMVITGAYQTDVVQVLQNLPLKIIYNENWEQGQSSSVKKAVQAISADVQAVVFLLADQPLVAPVLIRDIMKAYEQTNASIVVPRWNNRYGNPVLFDLRVWRSALLQLSGDEGARQIIRNNQAVIKYVEALNEQEFFDIDTPEEYHIMKKLWQDQKNRKK